MPVLKLLWWAPISIVALYLSACLLFGTGPLFLAFNIVGALSGLLLVIAVLVGAVWAWGLVGRGFFRKAAIILVAYVLMVNAVSQATAASEPFSPFVPNETTDALTGARGTLTQPNTFIFYYPFIGSCVLRAGNESSSESSGYRVFSISSAHSASMAGCDGFGYLQAATSASGIGATASAGSRIWWSANGISVPKTSTAYSLLSVGLGLSISGWQLSTSGPESGSQVTLQYAMKLVRDDGSQEYLFSKYFQNPAGFGGQYDPVYNNMLVESGHSYNIVVMFNATSYSQAMAPTAASSTDTCFGFPSTCGPSPGGQFGLNYCPAGVPSYNGNCTYIEWLSASYNITANYG